MWRALSWGLACVALGSGCGGDARATVPILTRNECSDRPDQTLCSSGIALSCVGGQIANRDTCGARTCVAGLGCRVCAPGATACDGNRRSVCNAAGSALTFVEECTGSLSCSAYGCADLCGAASTNRSYLGCDYWPVFTSNSLLDPLFVPAVAIGNGNLVPAHVVISKNHVKVAELDLGAGSAQTVELSFEPALQTPGGSRIVRQGAYHLTSSVPVTVHQFNPLLFEVERACTARGDVDGGVSSDQTCKSYTNDASLLFPSTALKQDPELTDSTVIDFIAASRASYMIKLATQPSYQGQGGFIAIVAVGSEPANVTVRSSAFTLPSPSEVDAKDNLQTMLPGETISRTLMPGDVLQLVSQVPTDCNMGVAVLDALSADGTLFCDPGSNYDLSGTDISSDQPIEVISGHDCANVPFDRWACDHLEESMVPLHAWGGDAVVTVPQSAAGSHYVLRLISGADNNTVTFDPPLHEPVTLARNQSLEFTAMESVHVQGTGRLMVAQYLMGQQRLVVGDPSMSIAVPVDQYRAAYNFVSPATYVRDYVDIISTTGDTVTLDGKLVDGFVRVGQSNFSSATVELTVPGAHEIHGVHLSGFAIVLYGLAPYTAYLLPGGLDLAPIGPIGI